MSIYEMAMAPGFLFGVVVTSSDSKWSPAVVVSPRTRNQSGRTRSRTCSNAVITRPVRSFKLWSGGHEIEVKIGSQAEQLLHAVYHLTMLRRSADDCRSSYYRSHLDRLRPGAVNYENTKPASE